MKIYKEINKKDQEVTEIYCNKCGKTLLDLEDQFFKHGVGDYGFPHEFEVSFGYADIADGEDWNFDLCSECILELVNSFQIPIEKTNYLGRR